MSEEKLEKALSNWQEQLAHYEYELSITSNATQKFELRKRIEECKEEVQRLKTNIDFIAPFPKVRSSIPTTSEPDKKEDSPPDIKPESEKGVNDTKLSERLPAEKLERQEIEESHNPQGKEALKLNYSNLEKSLRTKDWKNADEETFILLLQSLDRSKKRDLINFSAQAIENLSDEVLSQIDRLWKQYSHGKFGFSIQREIYLSPDSHRTLDSACNSEEWNDFCNRIGWRKQDRWVSLDNLYKTLNHQNFKGCLPSYRLFTKEKNDCHKPKLRERFRLLLSQFQS